MMIELESSLLKNTWHSCRAARFNVQHSQGGSQPSITSVPRDLMPLVNLQEYEEFI